MYSFCILSIFVLAATALLGYCIGFTRIIIFILAFTAASFAAFFSYTSLALWLATQLSLWDGWVNSTVFFTVFFLVFFLFFFTGKKITARFNRHSINKVTGLLTGIGTGFILLISIFHFTTVVSIPQFVAQRIERSNINELLDPPATWLDNEMLPVFETPPTHVMASQNSDSVSHEAVLLPYTTDKIELRKDLEMQLLQLVNGERAKLNLKLLVNDEVLNRVARAHSEDMFKRGYFSHNTPEGIDPFQRLRKAKVHYLFAGENLALAQTLQQAHKELMLSPGHRANILNRSYGRIGLGILQGGAHGLMITQEFRN